MDYCFTVDDVAYEGYSSADHLRTLIDFCRAEDLKGTWFVVPLVNGKELEEQAGYVEILKEATVRGDEVAQHGLEHERFETGIPPPMILALPHEGASGKRLETDREAIEAELTVERIRERLRRGRDILTRALGREVAGFRAGALSTCDNLYDALEAERYDWDSSKALQESAWDLIVGRENVVPREITRARFERMQPPGALRVLPLSAEYTWYLKQDQYSAFLELAKHDFAACLDARIPFVPVCHVSPILEGEGDIGLQLHRELLAFARATAAERGVDLEFRTLSETAGSK